MRKSIGNKGWKTRETRGGNVGDVKENERRGNMGGEMKEEK